MADHIKDCNGDCKGWECSMCTRCHFMFKTPESLFVPHLQDPEETRLCDLCMGIMDDTEETRAIAYVGNVILVAIAAKREDADGDGDGDACDD